MAEKKDRVFTTKDRDGNDWVLKFSRPSQKILNKGELVYRTVFSRALRQDVCTQAEIDNLLRERGIWNDKKEDKAEKMRVEIATLEAKLSDISLTNEQGKLVCEEIRRQRLDLLRHNSIYTQISDNTCETMASEARTQLFAAECVCDNKTDLRVFKDVDDFKERLDELSAQDSFREAMISSLEVVVGRELPSDLTTEYAENKWLTQRDMLDENGLIKEPEKKKAKKAKKKNKKETAKAAS